VGFLALRLCEFLSCGYNMFVCGLQSAWHMQLRIFWKTAPKKSIPGQQKGGEVSR